MQIIMNKTELINVVAAKTGGSKKDADKVIAATLDTIAETKPGPKISIFFIRQGKPTKVEVVVEEDLRFKNYKQ